MAIVFPASPSVNETFTAGSITYKWDGDKWIGLGVTPADRLIEGSNSLEITAGNDLVWAGDTVGIGLDPASDPFTSKLHVGGALVVSPNTTTHETIRFTTQGVDEGKIIMQDASNNEDVVINTGGNSWFRGGNVGIGVDTVSGIGTNLHIREANAGGDIGIRVQNHTTTDEVGGVPTTASLYLSTTTGTFDTARIQVARTDGDLRFGYGETAANERFRIFSPPSHGTNGGCVAQFHDDGDGAANSEMFIALTTGYPAAQTTEGTVRIGTRRSSTSNRAHFLLETLDNASNTMSEKFRITDSGALEIRTRGDRVNSGILSSKQVCISQEFINLSTTDVAMDDGLGYGNAGILTISIQNVDGDECIFQVSTGREAAVAHKYNLILGSNANCNVTNGGGNGGTFTISGLGDGRTYTLSFSNGSLGTAPNLRASSATTGSTYVVIHGLIMN